MQTILEVGDEVYQGGSQHILHQYDEERLRVPAQPHDEARRRLPGDGATGRHPLRGVPLQQLAVQRHEHLVEPDRLHPGRADQLDRRLRPEHPRVPAGVPAGHAVRRRRRRGRRRSTATAACGPVATSTTATRVRSTAASPSSARGTSTAPSTPPNVNVAQNGDHVHDQLGRRAPTTRRPHRT